jgi:hypothetical protein
MRAFVIGVIAATVLGCARGQATSPPPVCFAYNDQPVPPYQFSHVQVSYYAGLTLHFVSQVTSPLERIELGVQPVNLPLVAPPLAIDLYQTSAYGTPPTAPPIGSFSSQGGWPWAEFLAPIPPPTVTAGSSYAVRIFAFYPGSPNPPPPFDCAPVYYDLNATAPLLYELATTMFCPPSIPTMGSIGLIIRFRGTGCGPGPLASVGYVVGSFPCGHTTLADVAMIASTTPPVLGSPWLMSISAPANTTADLYWSVGVAPPVGWGFVPGSLCAAFLDQQSLLALMQLGVEPLSSLVVPAGGLTQTFWVPGDPALAGAVIGVQALVINPNALIPLGGGVFGQTTPALKLTLGY